MFSSKNKSLEIVQFDNKYRDQLITFFEKVFKENNRQIDFCNKDKDLLEIKSNYLTDGGFWLLVDDDYHICGSIGLRRMENYYEIRRFFILNKCQNNGNGRRMLSQLIDYSISINAKLLKIATLENSNASIHVLLHSYDFKPTKRYNNSSADIFYKLELTLDIVYKVSLNRLKDKFESTLILNPTENIPMYPSHLNSSFLEGLYISERFKDLNDKIIFSGRDNFIHFFEYVKNEWKSNLNAFDVDLKTLSGLNAHLVLFLTIIKPGDLILLLPEAAGGHFSTKSILHSIGANTIEFEIDEQSLTVDIIKTKRKIEELQPNYIFVDRSEGLYYEDFSWLNTIKSAYKIFDASQYLTQILMGAYTNPFDMGFDMILSTLHKNYPGPQKGLIATCRNSEIWNTYQKHAKTYISNTHPMNIANSLMPMTDLELLKSYSDNCLHITKKLEYGLMSNNIPVVMRNSNIKRSLHIWICSGCKENIYEYYLKLEQLNILVNYRLLPYKLGYGLRVGVSAAVRSGLKLNHVDDLVKIMTKAYFGSINKELQKESNKLILNIKKSNHSY